jgi:hypothetical protein
MPEALDLQYAVRIRLGIKWISGHWYALHIVHAGDRCMIQGTATNPDASVGLAAADVVFLLHVIDAVDLRVGVDRLVRSLRRASVSRC